MPSPIAFSILSILAGILLIVTSLFVTLAAINIFSSSSYQGSTTAQNAHRLLTIAASLGWSSLAVLIVVIIAAVAGGGFSVSEVSDSLLSKDRLSREDLLLAYKGEKKLSSGNTMSIIVLIVLIILTIVSILVGVLAAWAAIELGQLSTPDDPAKTAYSQAIIGAVASLGVIGLFIVATIVYFGIRNIRSEKLKDLQKLTDKAEERMGTEAKERLHLEN